MGEVTRLSDWFGSFWVKQSDGSRKVMHYSGNEFTQVSVRGSVTRDGRSPTGDIQLLTTRQATTFQHMTSPVTTSTDTSTPAAAAGKGNTEVVLGQELKMLPSITWSPLPPRRATAAAAQTLCVTLYCDDTLDDMPADMTPRIIRVTNANGTTDKSSALTAGSKKGDKSGSQCSDDIKISHDIGPNVFSMMNPYVPLSATPNLNTRNKHAAEVTFPDMIGMNIYPPLNNPPSKSDVKPNLQNYNSPLDNTNSPLHISHTPYSPPSSQRPTLRPPPLSAKQATPDQKFRSSKHQDGSVTPRKRRHKNHNDFYDINIASLCAPVNVIDASLTAHLPPWHSIGNVSMSYQFSSNKDINHNQRTANNDNEVRQRSKGQADCSTCYPNECTGLHSVTNQNDVLKVQTTTTATDHYPVVHSSPTVPPARAANKSSAALDSKSLVLPLKELQQKPPVKFKSSTEVTGLSTVPPTPISPSDSILSTGFTLSNSSLAQKPCTHPRDTPTHQPSITSPTRRVPPDKSTHDLRLDSIHDLNWLNAMEPKDQVLLEVHIIWSILTLMVVLLACYTIHHHPLTG